MLFFPDTHVVRTTEPNEREFTALVLHFVQVKIPVCFICTNATGLFTLSKARVYDDTRLDDVWSWRQA